MKKLIGVSFIKSALCLVVMFTTYSHWVNAQIKSNTSFIEDVDIKTIEGTLDSLLRTNHIPGAIFVIVKDGKIHCNKGFGYANIEKKIPADPDRTLFNIGSVGKLFTTIAVMQLAEQGKLDLNLDVNNYLNEFKIRNKYSKPVTLANLLTHTGGFDCSFIGMCSREYSKIVPLGEFLKNKMPLLIHEPGEIIQYDNYGMALAGYIVEQVSKMPFHKYVENQILRPLEMNNSTFSGDPLKKEYIASGYRYINGKNEVSPSEYLNIGPAGGIISTGSDMANFMIANLQNGVFKGNYILKDETILDMQKLHYSNYPGFPGMAYGFAINEGILSKGGDTGDGFHTQLCLVPEKNTGIFISVNGGDRICLNDVFSKIIARLSDKTFVMADIKRSYYPEDIKDFEGLFRQTDSYLKKSIAKILFFSPNPSGFEVTSNGKNILYYRNEPFTRIGPLLFENPRGDYLAFKRDDSGKIKYMFTLFGYPTSIYFEGNTLSSFERVSWHENYMLHTFLLLLFVLVFVFTIVKWVYTCLVRPSGKVSDKKSNIYRFSEMLSVGISILSLCFLISSIIIIPKVLLSGDVEFGVPFGIDILLTLPIITLFFTVLLVACLIYDGNDKKTLLHKRVPYTLLVFSSAGFILLLNYWNLLGFNF